MTMSAPSLKVAVVFHSRSGNTLRLARAIVTGAEHVPGASVTLRRVSELTDERELMAHEHTGKAFAEIRPLACATPADVLASDVVIFGCPTRFGSISAELKYFIDSLGPYWSRGEIRDKIGAAFTSASTYHGGHELTLMSLLAAMMHYGMFVVTPGYIDPIYDLAGAPYGATATTKPARVRSRPNADDIVAAKFLGQRTATVAAWIKAGREHIPR
jgi:NAD(P)H dehydrogenase (quinone)